MRQISVFMSGVFLRFLVIDQRPRQTGGRFSPKARASSLMALRLSGRLMVMTATRSRVS
jgi:hypothetical protein